MIRIFNDTKIYVQCPRNVQSGGAELLHQLVNYLRNNGLNAYIVYYVGEDRDSIPKEYQKYNIAIADRIEDSPHNISVLYETLFYQAIENTKIQKILWWLSVDNYFRCGKNYLALKEIAKWNLSEAFSMLLRRTYNLILKRRNYFKNSITTKKLTRLNVVSAYQSEYAQFFLQANGFKEIVPLKDYINIEHCSSFSKEKRENIILYNPKKGLRFTKKLMKLAPDLQWIPIENMSRDELIALMRKAKLYIDFGNHPGKDRLPRECAMNGLCIITGSQGSANFYEDVWINSEFKFNETKDSPDKIIAKIRETLINYNVKIDDFRLYRNKIMSEKVEFESQVQQLFLNPALRID